MEDLIRRVYEEAKALGACNLLTGNERTIEELVGLLRSPQGYEFCTTHSFPNLETWREFKKCGMETFGVYIDAGKVVVANPTFAVFVGATKAIVTCDTLELHEVLLLQGASSVINASDWAVCSVHAENGCSYMYNISDNAIAL